mmetsp:Transcript_33421/g.30423  ORF Transcript_33421/g.30423 Transcript_33421/m.30423 type:complete len:156 (+) Transcript_33421:317-784(+)
MTQMILPPLLFSGDSSLVTLKGGTLVSHSPPIRYYEKILFPLLTKFGIDVKIKVNSEGFYPNGGGEVEYKVEPVTKPLAPIKIVSPGKLKNVWIEVIMKVDDEATGNEYAKDMKKEVKRRLRAKYTDEEIEGINIEAKSEFHGNLVNWKQSKKKA